MYRLRIILLLLLAASAQDVAAQAVKASKEHLRLEVSADKSSYLVGEPVDLSFTLANVSRTPVKGKFCMGLDLYNPEVWYRRDKQKLMLYISNFPAAADYYCHPEDLPAGGAKSKTERLLYAMNPAGLILREPGEYEFQARYK